METGVILPRDIAVLLNGTDYPVYLTPFKYVLGELLLQTPREIRNNLGIAGIDIDEFVQAVVKRETSKNILNFGQFLPDSIPRWKERRAIQNIANYRGKYTAKVKSTGRKGPKFRKVRLQGPFITNDNFFAYKDIHCYCDDFYWSGVKPSPIMCRHLTPLEIVLYKDRKENRSPEQSLSGTEPPRYPSMPFDILDKKEIIMEALKDYYLNGLNQYHLNLALLNAQANYSSTLRNEVEKDRATFHVIRQEAQEVDESKIDREKAAYYESVLKLKRSIEDKLRSRQFTFKGYGLEFIGTPFETVSYRFEHPKLSVIYSLCINPDFPPVLVKRYLEDRTDRWHDANDIMSFHPLKRLGDQNKSVDFTTRREGLTEIIKPDTSDAILLNSYHRAIQ